MLSIGWSSGLAASVVSVEPWSPLAPHLLPGAAIVAVGGCRVTGAASWLECVSEAFLQPEQGYEVPVEWTRDAERCLQGGAEGPGCSDPNQLCFKSSADCGLSGCSEACLSARRVHMACWLVHNAEPPSTCALGAGISCLPPCLPN